MSRLNSQYIPTSDADLRRTLVLARQECAQRWRPRRIDSDFCIGDAVHRAARRISADTYIVTDALRKALGGWITFWENATGRTRADVLALFDQAIARIGG